MDPCPIRKTSCEICCMRSLMPQPWVGSIDSAFRISRSSVPCITSAALGQFTSLLSERKGSIAVFPACASLKRIPTFAPRSEISGFFLPSSPIRRYPMRHCYSVMLGFFVAPTLAAAQNATANANTRKAIAESPPPVAVPAWLSVGGQLRARAEAYHNGGFRPDNSDQYVLTRVLLNARVRPTRNTSLFVEGMDARGPWKNKAPAGAPFRDHADLRQLYFQIGADNSAQLLRAGRLELGFGDGRLVGSLPWANTARTFAGARGAAAGRGYPGGRLAAAGGESEKGTVHQNGPGNHFYRGDGSSTHVARR